MANVTHRMSPTRPAGAIAGDRPAIRIANGPENDSPNKANGRSFGKADSTNPSSSRYPIRLICGIRNHHTLHRGLKHLHELRKQLPRPIEARQEHENRQCLIGSHSWSIVTAAHFNSNVLPSIVRVWSVGPAFLLKRPQFKLAPHRAPGVKGRRDRVKRTYTSLRDVCGGDV